jgi:hypothetical protein
MRLVKLDVLLLETAIRCERDPVVAEFANRESYAATVLSGPAAYAAIDGGTLVAAGGLILHWRGRAEAWSLVSRYARRRQLVRAIRMTRVVLDEVQRDPAFRRIEMFVRCNCAKSFAAALGFAEEGYLKAWDPKQRDMRLFARIAA